MTTIVTDGKVMAADSYCGSECFHTNIKKIARACDGAILGCAGQASDLDWFMRWYEDGGRFSPNVSEDFDGLILFPNGQILCVTPQGKYFFHESPAAVGSGTPYAYGALEAGADPRRAVEIATRRDAFSGGAIQMEAL